MTRYFCVCVSQIYSKSGLMLKARNLQPVLLQNREAYRTQSTMIQFENYGKMPCLLLCVFQTQFVERSDYKSEPIIDAEYRRKSSL